MNEAFIGSIVMFAGNFAPRNWAFCDGSLLKINEHQALFSIMGATYGGDGRTTFALPDLRGRVPMHPGSGPGLTPRNLGDKAGTEANPQQIVGIHTSKEMSADTVSSMVVKGTAGETPNVQPSTCINFIICLNGTFPSRA
ncbi:MAG: tail fiber protein [Phaeodactylibacter sp.]|nr:tail fiber protein [Phaeodactylibacter sp.]